MTDSEDTRNTQIIAYVLAHPDEPLEKVAQRFKGAKGKPLTRSRVQAICAKRLVFRKGPFFYCRKCKKRVPIDPEKLRNRVQPDLRQFQMHLCQGCCGVSQ